MLFWASLVEAGGDYISWQQQALAELSTAPIDGEEGGESAYAYSNDTALVRKLVNTKYEEASAYRADYGNDPKLFWILGELGKLKQVFHLIDVEEEGRYYDPNSSEAQVIIKEYQSYYLKALDLNDLSDAPDHLAGSMLSSIGDDVLGTPEITARAMKKAGDLARASKDGTEWNTYEARLGIYARAKDYDNYLKTVNEMIERIPNNPRMDELEGYKRQAEELIAKRDGKAVPEVPQQDVYAASEPTTVVKETPVVKKAPQLERRKAPETEINGVRLEWH